MLPHLLLTALAVAQPAGHEAQNPLFKELRDSGVAVTAQGKAPLPAPAMADGLDAAAQRKAIEKVAGQDYEFDELTRRSVVAPQILKLRDVEPSDPKAPARGMDLYFVAYGDLESDVGGAFVERALGEGRKGDQARELKPEELAKRGIKLADPKHETYGQVSFLFLEKVELQATGRTYWTRTKDSFLAAARLDPRFLKDPQFPNRWRSPEKPDEWHPYGGSGQYLKVTRLAEPKGALFVEFHVIFTEPYGWFEGANLLRSKLPPAAQQIVRSMRRELLKEQKK